MRAAATACRDHDIGAVAVVAHGELVGVLSERDLVRALGDGLDPDTTLVTTAMTAMPRVMLRSGVRHLPVTEHDRVVGMLSIRDALSVMERERIIEPGRLMETIHDRPT